MSKREKYLPEVFDDLGEDIKPNLSKIKDLLPTFSVEPPSFFLPEVLRALLRSEALLASCAHSLERIADALDDEPSSRGRKK